MEWKKFFTSITGHEYEGEKKTTKKKLDVTSPDQEKDQPSSITHAEEQIDPDMPPLEDEEAPTRPKHFKFKKPTPRKITKRSDRSTRPSFSYSKLYLFIILG